VVGGFALNGNFGKLMFSFLHRISNSGVSGGKFELNFLFHSYRFTLQQIT
jgi:hypothetical protein